jgi:hypothetical protein
MQMVAMLYCLEDNDKGNLCICSIHIQFTFLNIFDLWLVQYADLKPADVENQW